MNRFQKRKKEQRIEKQHHGGLPLSKSPEDYLSAAFIDEPVKDSVESSCHPAPVPASKKAGAALVAEKLEKGLQTPLSEENVGLKMLKLMGFKTGLGIGKKEDGIREPLAFAKKRGRAGLGETERQEEAARKREAWSQARIRLIEQRRESFQAAMSSRFSDRRVASNLVKAMKTIETLDVQAGRERSCLWWSSADEQGKEEKRFGLKQGVQESVDFKEKPSMRDQNDTVAANQMPTMTEDQECSVDFELWQTLKNDEKLSLATLYLRESHSYCLYCGHQYHSVESLKEECPGNNEDDH